MNDGYYVKKVMCNFWNGLHYGDRGKCRTVVGHGAGKYYQ